MTSPLSHTAAQLRDADGTLRVMKSVYSLPWPSTNIEFDTAANLPTACFAVGVTRARFDAELADLGFDALPTAGEQKLGLLDLVHEPVLASITANLEASLPGISTFTHRYPLHGSSHGIGYLMNQLRNTMGVTRIHTLAGDYEGYAAQADGAGLEFVAVEPDDVYAISGETWFVANPSARDGEALDTELVAHLADNNRLVLDVAYHGMHGSDPTPVPANAWAVLWSLSKPWGLFWRRIGALYCNEAIGPAYGTRWFKDPARLVSAATVVARYSPSAMADRYRAEQHAVVESLCAAGIVAKPASTILLATVARDDVTADVWQELAAFERLPGVARLCITPLLEDLILK